MKTLSLIKCIYFNCKKEISNENTMKKLKELLYQLPAKFFSDAFNEFNQKKELFEIENSQELEKIINFEDKFAQINNYFEQYEIFRKFTEKHHGNKTCTSVGGDYE